MKSREPRKHFWSSYDEDDNPITDNEGNVECLIGNQLGLRHTDDCVIAVRESE